MLLSNNIRQILFKSNMSTSQVNSLAFKTVSMLFPFRLHEATDYPWRPSLTPFEFQKLLHNLTAIKIRGTYSERSKLVAIADDQTE